MNLRARDQRGTALVEAPLAICLLLLLGLGVTTLVQVVWTHLDLASAARTATRYAARVEYDPSATTITGDRRRTAEQVREWTAQVAEEAGVRLEDVTITSSAPLESLTAGDVVTVTIRTVVSNPLYRLAASTTNAVATVFRADPVFDEDGVPIKAEASTYVE